MAKEKSMLGEQFVGLRVPGHQGTESRLLPPNGIKQDEELL